jgi:hypothetical protein
MVVGHKLNLISPSRYSDYWTVCKLHWNPLRHASHSVWFVNRLSQTFHDLNISQFVMRKAMKHLARRACPAKYANSLGGRGLLGLWVDR